VGGGGWGQGGLCVCYSHAQQIRVLLCDYQFQHRGPNVSSLEVRWKQHPQAVQLPVPFKIEPMMLFKIQTLGFFMLRVTVQLIQSTDTQ
jgi:hypothetical protein